ncbi:cytochrome d ubiquinol oxidase subunit II [Microlunatus elymi]|uniref:Cytochrome d ubiquinol oxidase subunit II n=1 Tax=Microlunatus elymi TaxID=2596828 RepID=A0A516Q121_9ACTN|nr:cytochrome d ubiquinol oxidase subunit II [Microlunatus elymi]QDP96911.1 cytochrome d ubiquinol oxidase subunit II [Microlunatus elymi]
MSTAVAIVLLIAVVAYAIFAGADFGAGFWDLIAGGPDRGARSRGVIEHSIGPVWEANHVWLIFILVVLWTSFPPAYASITLTLYVPMMIAALGIVLRGAGFAFRKVAVTPRNQRILGGAFAIPSVLVPYAMGAMAGGVASGRVPTGGRAGDPVHSWINPTSIMGGVLAVAAVAYLAAVYLVWDARRLGDPAAAEYFRRRAVGAGCAVVVVAAVSVVVLHADARYLFDGLFSRALPLLILGVLCGVGALLLLVRGAAAGARLLAVLAVASIVTAWMVGQWPYLLPTSLTASAAASPNGTLTAVLVAVGLAAVTVLPAFIGLYVLDQLGKLPDEGVDDVADRQLDSPRQADAVEPAGADDRT